MYQEHDRLVIIFPCENEGVSLVGFHATHLGEKDPDLQNGFPCEGEWTMDYVDQVYSHKLGDGEKALDYAQSTSNNLWGTVYSYSGEVLRDDLLEWNTVQLGPDTIHWARRNEEAYLTSCMNSFEAHPIG